MLMEPLDLAAVSNIYVCPSLVPYTACLHRYMVAVITLTFPIMLYTSHFLAALSPFYLYFPPF